MSIQGEINQISGNIAAAYTAVEAKSGTLPEAQNSDNLASAVSSIRQTIFVDSNPIGTIISFMGTQAPDSYLICDGAEYNVADYPDLSSFFTKQFGSANYFGGDGTATFAVPDMRNLFLRGYHGEATEQLSGDLGIKQEATNHPSIHGVGTGRNKAVFSYCTPENKATGAIESNEDSRYKPNPMYALISQDGNAPIDYSSNEHAIVSYTSRPVNMAVLYCIKAVESVPTKDVYSTEETCIGTWADGKPIYRKAISIGTFIMPGMNETSGCVSFSPPEVNIDTMIRCNLSHKGYNSSNPYFSQHNIFVEYYKSTHEFRVWQTASSGRNSLHDAYIILEYTKTTD